MTERFLPTGLNGATGEGLGRPSPSELAEFARRDVPDRTVLAQLKSWLRWARTRRHRGLHGHEDPRDLANAGWGVIFAAGDEKAAAIHEALGELLEHRRKAASRLRPDRYRALIGADGYAPGETKQDFLARFGMTPGPAEPDRLPYYLLLVGDPEAIPFSFQYQLDIQYAVGRIHFETLDEHAHYAASVVRAETEAATRLHRAVVFAPRHPGDQPTEVSADKLAVPVADHLAARCPGWTVECVLAAEATKARLARLLGGEETPDFLFTVSHGLLFPPSDERHLPHQGALLCQDWPGPSWRGRIPRDHYFSGEDLADSAALRGLVSFHWACYSAGTPAHDDFSPPAERELVPIADRAFVARLPQRLLGHLHGALAVIGHVERAWSGYSIEWPGAGRQIRVFEDTLRAILDGDPVGLAMEHFGERYAELASDLALALAMSWRSRDPDLRHLANTWTASNDARNYVVLGDPAVRLGR